MPRGTLYGYLYEKAAWHEHDASCNKIYITFSRDQFCNIYWLRMHLLALLERNKTFLQISTNRFFFFSTMKFAICLLNCYEVIQQCCGKATQIRRADTDKEINNCGFEIHNFNYINFCLSSFLIIPQFCLLQAVM